MLSKHIDAKRTPSEMLIYSTLRIGRSDGGSGTGFIVRDVDSKGTSIPLLITNQHVLEGCDSVNLSFHKIVNENIEGSVNCTIGGIQKGVNYHPNKEIDLVALPLNPILKEFEKDLSIFVMHVDSFSLVDEESDELSAVEDVLMVGYPNGLSDEINNHPLFRSGITATHPKSDFRGQPTGVVDIAAFPGSSGSPIYIHRRQGHMSYQQDKGYSWRQNESLMLLGILFAGPQIDAEGEFDIVEIPNRQVGIGSSRVMMNLGYYVKARELKTLLNSIYAPRNFVPVDVGQGNASTTVTESSGQIDSTP